MPKKLSQEEYEQRVFDCVGDKYSVIGTYLGKEKPIELHCNIHNCDFTVTASSFMRGKNDIRAKCPMCKTEERNNKFQQDKVDLICAYCGKTFSRNKSKLINSKSGLYFCCREHKDLAQKISSGKEFSAIRPYSYNKDFSKNYRLTAFSLYDHKCTVCGWDEDPAILEVHHINENHEDNNPTNLMILCPICHRKISSHLYYLQDNKIIKKHGS